MNDHDKRYLAESFVAFFNRDYRRVAQMHVESGWTPADTNIDEFEQAFREVCEPIFAKPLSEVSFGHVLLNLFNVAREFNMQVQPQLVLLQKTLLYIEGLGRQLYPQLDLWDTAKPFLQNWLDEQMGVKAVLKTVKQKLPYWREHFAELPENVMDALQQQRVIVHQLIELNRKIQKKQHTVSKYYALLIGALVFISTLLQFQQLPGWLSAVFFTLSFIIWLLGLLVR